LDEVDRIVHSILLEGSAATPGHYRIWTALNLLEESAASMLDSGNVAEGREWLETYDRWLDWCEAVIGRSQSSLLWGRYHRLSQDSGKARACADRAYGHASNPRQPLALIAADRFLGQLDVDEGKYDDAATRLAASLELAERCEAPFEQALTLVVMAERAAKLGEIDEARRLIARVREICEPLGAKPTLERIGEIEALLPRTRRSGEEHPFGLTGREVEVLRLVARGRTDAEAAEELFISPRTVSQHLRNAYNKLGVNNRAEATRVVVERGIA
jgi:DNA-binding CsgD family transcriptional regulator